jgi:hypothetical protein
MAKYRNGSGSSTIPMEISGLQVALQKRSKRQSAELLNATWSGRTKLGVLTKVQLGRIYDVSPQYAHKIARENSAPPVVTLLAAE